MVAELRDRCNLKISEQWSLALVRWLEHLKRHPANPASLLLDVQTDLWVETMRALRWTVSTHPSLRGGGTGTRSGPGKPIRWAEHWVDALHAAFGLENPTRDKALSRQRAQLVQAMLENGRLHGVQMCT